MAASTHSSPTVADAAAALADASRPPPTAAAAGDALLAPAVASDASKAVSPAADPDLDREFGFQRPDFRKENLAGTVGFHQRHVFVCYKGADHWPCDVEGTNDSIPSLLAAAIEARKADIKMITKLTICEGGDGTESSLGDVLIFPDMIRYRGLTHFNVDNFVEEVLVKDVEWLPGSPEAIKGSYVFVCAHGSRDKRCSVCGPALITRFKEEIGGQGLDGQVSVSACSHVGGHKYAGNVIIFNSDAKGEVTGHWYGYVAPDDVPVLLHKHIGQGEIVDHLWRGQLGMSEEEQLKALVCSREHGLGSVMQGKFLIPPNFNGDAALNHFAIHGFRTAGQLKDAVNKTKKWLSTKTAAGLLTNGSIFVVEPMGICDEKYQENGAVCLIRNEGVSEIHPTGHLYTTKTGGTALQDRKPETVPLGELFITRCDFGGNRWTFRKFSVEGDDTFVVLQWRPRVTDDEFELKKPIQSSNKIVQYEDGSGIINSIAMIEEMADLSNSDKAKAIIIVKAEENQTILANIKSKEVRVSWLQEEIKRQERVWERSAGGNGS